MGTKSTGGGDPRKIFRVDGHFIDYRRTTFTPGGGAGNLRTQGILATGGTTQTYFEGDTKYKSHTFLSSGTFTVTRLGNQNSIDCLIVAGGGQAGTIISGGGGAGGMYITSTPVNLLSYTITVGEGGSPTSGTVSSNSGYAGQDSRIYSSDPTGADLVATGGGGGGTWNNYEGRPGGSGGGGSGSANGSLIPGGPSYGNGLGNSGGGSTYAAGSGGGGAGAVGGNAVATSSGGAGGNGAQNNYIDGTNVYYAGGGAGTTQNGAPRPGGLGGGGDAGASSVGGSLGSGQNGATNTGGGGGAMGHPAPGSTSGNGGPGIVVIRYIIGPDED